MQLTNKNGTHLPPAPSDKRETRNKHFKLTFGKLMLDHLNPVLLRYLKSKFFFASRKTLHYK